MSEVNMNSNVHLRAWLLKHKYGKHLLPNADMMIAKRKNIDLNGAIEELDSQLHFAFSNRD